MYTSYALQTVYHFQFSRVSRASRADEIELLLPEIDGELHSMAEKLGVISGSYSKSLKPVDEATVDYNGLAVKLFCIFFYIFGEIC